MAIVINNLSVSMIDTDAELYAIWPQVRDGINSIEKRCKGVWYRPEDVYHEIKNKQLTLLIGSDAQTGEYQGFAIITECQFPDGKGMHIRSMHHAGNEKGFVDDFIDALEVMAKLCDVVRISYSSSRKGWEKRTKHKEYVKVSSVHYFERVLSWE